MELRAVEGERRFLETPQGHRRDLEVRAHGMLNLLREVADAGRRMKGHGRVGHRVDVRQHIAALALPVVDELLLRLRASDSAERRQGEGDEKYAHWHGG